MRSDGAGRSTLSRSRSARLLALVAVALWSCAPLYRHGGARVGPDGQRESLRHDLAHQRWGVALERLSRGWGSGTDELLKLQHLALVAHYAGEPRRSNAALHWASRILEDRQTRRISRELLSTLTDDRALPYRPPTLERLFLHYYGALNYLDLGEPEDAAVEARRLSLELQRLADGQLVRGPPGEGRSTAGQTASDRLDLLRVLNRFAGVVFEAAGEEGEAEVAYRRARALDSAGPGDGSAGDLVVVVERGFIAHRVSETLRVGMRREELQELRKWEGPVSMGEIPEVARRIAVRTLSRSPATGSNDASVRVAWPALAYPRRRHRTLSARAVDGAGSSPSASLDLSAALHADYRDDAPSVLARALVRAGVKSAIRRTAEESQGGDDGTVGELAGVLARAALPERERADTRSWHLLPGRIDVVRLRLPPGRSTIVVEAVGTTGGRRRIGGIEATIRPGRLSLVTTRIWEE